MSRAAAISLAWAFATDDAQGCSARASRPAAARSAFSLLNRLDSRASTEGTAAGTRGLGERLMPGRDVAMEGSGRGTGVSAEAGTALPAATSARASAGAGQILRNAAKF